MIANDREIVDIIASETGIAPAELAHRLGISQRTLREHIQRCNRSLEGIARITYSRRIGGYEIAVEDRAAYQAWTERTRGLMSDDPASSVAARTAYLANDLLLRDDWVTLDTLAEVLFVSRACISGDLKRIEPLFARYGLSLEKRPRYGIRVVGSEIGRRLCLTDAAIRRLTETSEHDGLLDRELTPLLHEVSSCVDEVLEQESFSINSLSYQNLVTHIAIAILRIRRGSYIQAETITSSIAGTRELAVAQLIAKQLADKLQIELPKSEVGYLAIHLAGKRVLYEGHPNEEGTVITDEIWDLVSRMLEVVYKLYRFDFRGNMELRMNLARHIAPLAVRLTYHMHLENPLLDDIKSRYPLPYAMAGEAAMILADAYGSYPSEHELGYIAMAFALALEQHKTNRAGSHVLVVCASGLASAHLLAYKIQQEYGAQIASIETCNVTEVPTWDFSQIDYVFTTVPLNAPVPVPVREITLMLTDADRELMKSVLSGKTSFSLAGYFPQDLFFSHDRFASKQEAITTLCERLRRARPKEIPDAFEDLIWQREEMAPTSFGEPVALPHPIEAVSESTFVAISLLDEPLDWGPNSVRAIFLLSVTRDPNAKLSEFYGPLASLLNDAEAIGRLVKDQTYTRLIDELRTR